VKRPGERPTALQVQVLQAMRNAYGYAMWADCYEDVVQFVRELA
jgi:hypothetical protein